MAKIHWDILWAITEIKEYSLSGRISREGEKAISKLSEFFYDISKDEYPHVGAALENFYLINFCWPDGDFKGKSVDDFRLQSWLFGKDIETYKEMSKRDRGKLVDKLHELHRFTLPDSGHGQYSLAA